MISSQTIKDFCREIVEKFQSEKIILFGSYAYGEPNQDSDIDLLVVVPHSDKPSHRRATEAYRALRGILVPTDVIVLTEEEIERKQTVRSSLVSQVLREGILLYEEREA